LSARVLTHILNMQGLELFSRVLMETGLTGPSLQEALSQCRRGELEAFFRDFQRALQEWGQLPEIGQIVATRIMNFLTKLQELQSGCE
jgi:hypothetical protein